MKRENFYRRDPGLALAGMQGMTLEERGVYNTVLDLLYLTWRPVEDNRGYIAAHCGCAVQRLNPIVSRLIAAGKLVRFEENGQFYISNPRFEAERKAVKGASKTRSGRGEVGEKSGEVGEKSASVEENAPLLEAKSEENQDVKALDKTRVDKTRVEPPSPPLGDDGDQTETSPEQTPTDPGLFDPVSQDPDPPPDDVETAFNAWNDLARRLGLPVAKVLDEGRRRSIRKRLAEGGLEAWTQALRAIAASRHCRGGNDRKWRADLDFVCQPKSWRRLLEGFYGEDADDTHDPTAGWAPDQWRRALAMSRDTGRWDTELGPPPGQPGCRIPPDVLRELRTPPRLAAVEGRAVA